MIQGYREFRINLSDAASMKQLHCTGDTVTVRRSSDSTAEILIMPDPGTGPADPVSLRFGEGVANVPFSSIYYSHASQPGAWVVLAIGRSA